MTGQIAHGSKAWPLPTGADGPRAAADVACSLAPRP